MSAISADRRNATRQVELARGLWARRAAHGLSTVQLPVISVAWLDYKRAPVDLRELAAVPPHALAGALKNLLRTPGVRHAVVLSTCNRTEVYVEALEGRCAKPALVRRVLPRCEEAWEQLAEAVELSVNEDAVRHLLRVAAGLESQVLGEAEIQGQVRAALRAAKQAGAVAGALETMFAHALRVGKRVRSETSLGQGCSVGDWAVAWAEDRIGPLQDRHILLIGTGKVARLVCRSLSRVSVRTLAIWSHSPERAAALAGVFTAGRVIAAPDLGPALAEADVVICATWASEYLIRPQQIASRRKPLVIIDLSVPRVVHPEIGRLGNVTVAHLDDLARARSGGVSPGLAEAEAIVEEEAARVARLLWPAA